MPFPTRLRPAACALIPLASLVAVASVARAADTVAGTKVDSAAAASVIGPAAAAAAPATDAAPAPAPAAPAAADDEKPQPAALELAFTPFEDKLFVEARQNGVPIVLYFEADWCAPCRKMHETTFRSPAVVEAAAGIRLFRVDMTRPNSYLDLVEKSFRITGAPTVVLFGPDGQERQRQLGFIPAATFAKMLSSTRKPATNH
ncbi:MAG TPA: thioredoxin fold domain-containing protein [Candidatus Binatia bacterium]